MAACDIKRRSSAAACGPDFKFVADQCTCDPHLVTPTEEVVQSATLLKYTTPFKVLSFGRKTDIKPKLKEIGAKPDTILLTDHSPETQEVLNCIQQPRMWTKKGQLWKQVVSPATTKRYEILMLVDDLNQRLWERNARPHGVCRVRYDIFSQLFDEITRQVTVTCAERGLQLVRIRSELKLTTLTYHSMWRNVMAHFEPIVDKSNSILTNYQDTVNGLREEISVLLAEMEDVHWQTQQLEIDRACERQAMLESYRCQIESEHVMMKRLNTLKNVIATGDFRSDPSETGLSIDEDGDKPKTKKTAVLSKVQEIQFSDILHDLVLKRKVAEGRTKTKKALEDEIIWVKGEISKNKAFLVDLLRIKEPLNFGQWLEGYFEGSNDRLKTSTDVSLARDFDLQSAASVEKSKSSSCANKLTKTKLMSWLASKEPNVCSCKTGNCRQEVCRSIDWELIVHQARSDYLQAADNNPTRSFRDFFKNWMKHVRANDVFAVANFFDEPPRFYRPQAAADSATSLIYSTGQNESKDLKKNPYEIVVSTREDAFKVKGKFLRPVLKPAQFRNERKNSSEKNTY